MSISDSHPFFRFLLEFWVGMVEDDEKNQTDSQWFKPWYHNQLLLTHHSHLLSLCFCFLGFFILFFPVSTIFWGNFGPWGMINICYSWWMTPSDDHFPPRSLRPLFLFHFRSLIFFPPFFLPKIIQIFIFKIFLQSNFWKAFKS